MNVGKIINRTGFGKAIKGIITGADKAAAQSTNKTAADGVHEVIKQTKNKPLFCHEYWADAQKEGLLRPLRSESVSLHWHLNGINHHLVSASPYPKHMDMPFNVIDPKLTPREMITQTSFEFKRLKPIKEKLTAIRCIGEKPDWSSDYKAYQRLLAVKNGDTIRLNGYPYAAVADDAAKMDSDFAAYYLTNNRGIKMIIDVDEGSRVSRLTHHYSNGKPVDEIVFDRCSSFRCTGTRDVKDGNMAYREISLRYIKPDEPWRTEVR